MANYANKYGVARINQEGERLFTVRPRYKDRKSVV